MVRREFDGIRVELNNLDKVLYPATGTTKGEVIDYYVAIASVALPHLAGRPATRKRWPNGVDQPAFFEKNLPPHAPAWLTRRTIEHSSRRVVYPVLDSPAALAWIGQQAALEIHVPQWRFAAAGGGTSHPAAGGGTSHPAAGDAVGPATRLVFDLDPGDGVGLPECARIAITIRDLVAEIGLAAYPVTSGSKGIHVYVPLDRQLRPDGASEVAKQVAANLAALHPDLVTATMAKAARAGRVFLDWSQNNPSKTTVAPYSLRGRAHPTVAAPRHWAELEHPRLLRQLRFEEVLDRLDRDGDLLAALDADPDPLARYRAKRDPARTPEPIPAQPRTPDDGVGFAASGGGHAFVIQEHHARRLHWDLRLERDGVLVSWAVPKGIPDTSDTNHLAIHTEDHPLEYLTFAGDIPRGEYGGGRMSIWDTGTYEVEKWRVDEVIVTLHGSRVDGRYALIRTDGQNWLLHKTRQPAAAGLPRGLSPMLATPGQITALDAAEWAFEPKVDGFRLIVEIDAGALTLRSRAGLVVTDNYPRLAELAGELADHAVVLDGEIVVYDETGRTSFRLLQTEGRRAQFLAFDVLYLDGVSLLRKRYADRRRVLVALAAHAPALTVLPQLPGPGDAALARSVEQHLEGVVAKRLDSTYLPGKRAKGWVKQKNWRTLRVVVGGWRPGEGSRGGGVGSLLVGVEDHGTLTYIGRVGTGFSDALLRSLAARLSELARETSPFANELEPDERRDAVWVEPVLRAEIRYLEWTEQARLRHPALVRFEPGV